MMIDVMALDSCEWQRDAIDDFAASLRKRTSAKKNPCLNTASSILRSRDVFLPLMLIGQSTSTLF